MPAQSFDAQPADGDAPPLASGRQRSLVGGNRAIIFGAVAAVALIFSAGLGWSAPSPHPWLGFGGDIPAGLDLWKLAGVQLVAAGLCGHLAGRPAFRSAAATHQHLARHERRDAVMAWVLTMLLVAVLSVVGGGAGGRASVFGGLLAHDVLMRQVNGLFLSPQGPSLTPLTPQAQLAARRAVNEVADVFINAGAMAALPPSDLRYVGRLVALRTALSQREAELRVGEAHAQFRRDLQGLKAEAQASEARQYWAFLAGSLWLGISLLAGAWVANKVAMYGRRQR